MDEKTIEAIGESITADLQAISAVVAKGGRVEIWSGPDGAVKIVRIKRQFVNTGRETGRPKS